LAIGRKKPITIVVIAQKSDTDDRRITFPELG